MCCTDLRQILALTFGCGWVVIGSLVVFLCLVRPMLSRRFGMPDPGIDENGQPRGAGNGIGNGGEILQTRRRRFKLISAEKWNGPDGDARRAEGWLLATVKMAREAEGLIRADIRLPSPCDPSQSDVDKGKSGAIELTVGLQDGVAELIEDDDAEAAGGEPARTLRMHIIDRAGTADSTDGAAPAYSSSWSRRRAELELHGAAGVSASAGSRGGAAGADSQAAGAASSPNSAAAGSGGAPQMLLITLPERVKCGPPLPRVLASQNHLLTLRLCRHTLVMIPHLPFPNHPAPVSPKQSPCPPIAAP